MSSSAASTRGPELITPPDEQSQGMHHGVQSLPMQAADVAMHVVAPTATTLPNIYVDVINNTFSMQFVLSMDSACECYLNVLFNFYYRLTSTLGEFLVAIHQCPGWKVIFLGIFHEHWFWCAMMSSTVTLPFVHLLQEALQRQSFQPSFTLEDSKFHYLACCHALNWFSAVNMDKDSQRILWHYCDEWVQNDMCSFSAPGFTKAKEESH